MNKLVYTLFLCLHLFVSNAQEIIDTKPLLKDTTVKTLEIAAEPKMADAFRSEGKIYVVIAVLAIIFICLIAYLIYIDIKLRKIENKVK